MSPRAFALTLLPALWAAPPLVASARAECAFGRVVIVPFDYLAAEAKVAKEAEQQVREAANRRLGGCVEAREATVRRLERVGPFLSSCPDDACRAARAQALEAEAVLEGMALGVGGRPTLALWLWGRDGRAVRRSVPLEGPPERAGQELEAFFGSWARKSRRSSPGPYLALGAAAGAVAAGAAFGALMQQNQQALSSGVACSGSGDVLASCLEARLAEGRRQELIANVLFGAGAALVVSGTVWLVWEWP